MYDTPKNILNFVKYGSRQAEKDAESKCSRVNDL